MEGNENGGFDLAVGCGNNIKFALIARAIRGKLTGGVGRGWGM